MTLAKVVLLLTGVLYGFSYGQSTSSGLIVSSDGFCAGTSNQTCLTSTYGDCCSSRGFCGSTNDYCNPSGGCQSSFGSCVTNSSLISVDGKCGSTDPNKQVCVGSTFGSCCSEQGWCGNTTTYCSAGCQAGFGTCGGTGVSVNTGSGAQSSTSASLPSSSTTASSSAATQTKSHSAELQNTKSTLKATQVGLGVVAGLLAVALGVVAWLLFRRRKSRRTAPHESVEKADFDTLPQSSHAPSTPPKNATSAVSAAPPYASQNGGGGVSGDNVWPQTKPMYEIGDIDKRAELGGHN